MEDGGVVKNGPVQAAHNLGWVPRHMYVVEGDSAKELFARQANSKYTARLEPVFVRLMAARNQATAVIWIGHMRV